MLSDLGLPAAVLGERQRCTSANSFTNGGGIGCAELQLENDTYALRSIQDWPAREGNRQSAGQRSRSYDAHVTNVNELYSPQSYTANKRGFGGDNRSNLYARSYCSMTKNGEEDVSAHDGDVDTGNLDVSVLGRKKFRTNRFVHPEMTGDDETSGLTGSLEHADLIRSFLEQVKSEVDQCVVLCV